MTLHETAVQIHNLSVGGYINGEKFSRARLENQLRMMFRPEAERKLGNIVVMQIALRDGWWFFLVTEYAKGEFDYEIPDTREQEARIMARLLA